MQLSNKEADVYVVRGRFLFIVAGNLRTSEHGQERPRFVVYTINNNINQKSSCMKKCLSLLLALVVALSVSAQKVQTNPSERAANPNVELGKALKNTGIMSLSIGVPCVAAGVASLLYANLLPNPTNGYTTSKTLAEQNPNLQYMSATEYIGKLEEYNGKVKAANNAGYLFTGAGAALTIIGIPLYCYGKRIMTLDVNYTGNGAGIALNF